MLQSRNIGFRLHNIVKFIGIGIMAMDKITTDVFKLFHVNKFSCKLPTACIKSIAMHSVGWGTDEYIQKLEELIPVHNSVS